MSYDSVQQQQTTPRDHFINILAFRVPSFARLRRKLMPGNVRAHLAAAPTADCDWSIISLASV